MAREVAYRDGTTTWNENLPYPRVHYPGHYGAFFGFQEDEDSEIALCLCAKEAVENYAEYRQDFDRSQNAYAEKDFLLSSRQFPQALVQQLMDAMHDFQDPTSEDASLTSHLVFEDGLCHMCNEVVPDYRYCADMYGTQFDQNYGWYVKMKKWEYGLEFRLTEHPLEVLERLPSDVREELDDGFVDGVSKRAARLRQLREKKQTRQREIEEARREALSQLRESEKFEQLGEDEQFRRVADVSSEYRERSPLSDEEAAELERLQEEFGDVQKQIGDSAENEVRRAVGHYEKGNRWTSETILYQLVETEYGDIVTVERHHRPDWLDGLELDIYIPEARVGIEYHGIQHFEAVEHWGGEEALERRRERDELTRKRCRERGVELVEFRYDAELTRDTVRERLDELIKRENGS